jgi:hypothetical protein
MYGFMRQDEDGPSGQVRIGRVRLRYVEQQAVDSTTDPGPHADHTPGDEGVSQRLRPPQLAINRDSPSCHGLERRDCVPVKPGRGGRCRERERNEEDDCKPLHDASVAYDPKPQPNHA